MPCLNPIPTPIGDHFWPCGRCAECCKKYSLEWAQRVLDEFNSCGRVGCFVTLTYDDEHLPSDRQLVKSDLQKFMKRLRKSLQPQKIRYFACGEYGGKGRPHYHAILFGYRPSDLVQVTDTAYRSASLARIWKLGFISVGDINLKTAMYCAKYLAKCDERYHDVKPFTLMSRCPGLGALVISPEMLLTGERFIDGQRFLIPRYYLDKLAQSGYNTDMLRSVRSQIVQDALSPDLEDAARASAAFLRSGKKRYTIHI